MAAITLLPDEPMGRAIIASAYSNRHFVTRIDGKDHILESWSWNRVSERVETEWIRLDAYKRSCRVPVSYVLRRGGVRAAVRLLRDRFKHRRLEFIRLK